MNKAQWIERTMQSLDAATPATAPPHLHTRVLARIQPPANPKMVHWQWAAGLGLVVLLNVLTVLNMRKRGDQPNPPEHPVAAEYGLHLAQTHQP